MSTSRSGPTSSTLRQVPWQPEVAWCLGEAWTLDGSDHWPVCPRALLERVIDAYAAKGLTPIVAPELEFFLLERDPDGPGGLRRYVDELSRVYTVGAVSDPREIVLRMLLWCDELGLQAFAANHEFMNSQYEINVKHSEALDAADRAFMLRAAVKEIAVREGMLATFMGRPFADQGGSGFHLHLSLPGRTAATPLPTREGRTASAHWRPVHRRRDRARARACRRSSARPSTPTSGSCPTASRRRTRTGATTTAPRSAGCPTSAGHGLASRSAPGRGGLCRT